MAAGSSQDAEGYVAASGYTWIFGKDESAFSLYRAEALPTNVFIDRYGNVSKVVLGSMEVADIEAELKKIL